LHEALVPLDSGCSGEVPFSRILGILEMKARILLMEVLSCSKRSPPLIDDDREAHNFNLEKEFS
jgi:hypothetical protein